MRPAKLTCGGHLFRYVLHRTGALFGPAIRRRTSHQARTVALSPHGNGVGVAFTYAMGGDSGPDCGNDLHTQGTHGHGQKMARHFQAEGA